MNDFDEIEHTADRAFRVRGANLAKLLENAARAMTSLHQLESREEASAVRAIEVEGIDRETLLVNWLNEILYLEQIHGEFYDRFHISDIRENRLRGQLCGRRSEESGTQIKAATFHELEVRQTPEGFEATIVLDV